MLCETIQRIPIILCAVSSQFTSNLVHDHNQFKNKTFAYPTCRTSSRALSEVAGSPQPPCGAPDIFQKKMTRLLDLGRINATLSSRSQLFVQIQFSYEDKNQRTDHKLS